MDPCPCASTAAPRSFDGCGPSSRPVGRDGDDRRLPPVRLDPRGPRPARVVRRRVRRPRVSTSPPDRTGNQWAWWGDPDRGRADGRPRRRRRLAPRLGARRRGLRRPARCGLGARGGRRAARTPGFAPARPVGRRLLRRRGGRPVRRRLRRLARHHRGARGRPRPRPHRRRRRRRWPRRWRRAGRDPATLGRDDETLARVGTFVELHVEQGRALADPDAYDQSRSAVGVGSDIWPHGRWRVDVPGDANHAGTTRLDDRDDAMLKQAALVLAARAAADAARLRRDGRQGPRRTRRSQRHRQPRRHLARRPRRRRGGGAPRRRRPAGSRRAARRRPSPRSRGPRPPGSTPTWSAAWRPRSGPTRRSSAPGPVTTRESLPRKAFRRRCCSSATPPASPTRRRARRPGRLPRRRRGPHRGAHRPRRRRRRDDVLGRARLAADRTGDLGADHRDRRSVRPDPVPRARPPRRRPAPRRRPPRARQHPQPRLPPRPARADPRRQRQLLDVARADVCGHPATEPRHVLRPGPSDVRRDGRWPASPSSASSTTCTTARPAGPTPTRTPWATP